MPGRIKGRLVPGIHVCYSASEYVDGIGRRACPKSGRSSPRVEYAQTCGDEPGHDDEGSISLIEDYSGQAVGMRSGLVLSAAEQNLPTALHPTRGF
jgi:hypothetical protein